MMRDIHIYTEDLSTVSCDNHALPNFHLIHKFTKDIEQVWWRRFGKSTNQM